ncbi:hypothetical protein HRbin15_02161 [bacterium HR15]|nr:hypothetical protein HRbin15_02161 [bacterium HR15]
MSRRNSWCIGFVVSALLTLWNVPASAQDVRCCSFNVRHNFRVCLPRDCQPRVQWCWHTHALAWAPASNQVSTNSGCNFYPVPSTDTQCATAVAAQECAFATACARFQVDWIPGTHCIQGFHEAFGRSCVRCRRSGASAAARSRITVLCGTLNAAGQVVWQPAFQDVVGGRCGVQNTDPVILHLSNAAGQQRQDTLFDLRSSGFNWETQDLDGDGWGDSARIVWNGRGGECDLLILVGGDSLQSPGGRLHLSLQDGIVTRAERSGIFARVPLPSVGDPMPAEGIPMPAEFNLQFQVPQGWMLDSIDMGGDGSAGHSRADIDGSGCVDDADLLAVLFAFGQMGELPEDVDGNGIVDDADLLAVLFAFGEGC